MTGVFKSFDEMPSSEPVVEAAQNPTEIRGTREYFEALSNEQLANEALDAMALLVQRDPKIMEDILAKVTEDVRLKAAEIQEAA